MTEPDILYPAIFIFSMLLIGLLLTMWEFSRLQKSARAKAKQEKPVTRRQPEQTGQRIRNASGF